MYIYIYILCFNRFNVCADNKHNDQALHYTSTVYKVVSHPPINNNELVVLRSPVTESVDKKDC